MNLNYLLLGIFSFICVASATRSFIEDLDVAADNLIHEFPAQTDITHLWVNLIKSNLRPDGIWEQLAAYIVNSDGDKTWDPNHLRTMHRYTRVLRESHPEIPTPMAIRLSGFLINYMSVIGNNLDSICEKSPRGLEYKMEVEKCLSDIQNKTSSVKWY